MNKKDINIEYGKILREYRNKNNLTQENVSELSGLAPRYISQIERGELKGSINTLLTFCNAYKITPNDILIDFLDSNNNLKRNSYDYKINKLSIRDKEIIDGLIDYLLNH
jgi:transcriptional regulator with XRE-family HTH domain